MIAWPSREAYLQQIDDLDAAIKNDPDAFSNYLIRGEFYLALGFDAFAAIDFEYVLKAATQAIETKDWGIIAQVARDRALRGLETTEARLRKKRRQ